MSLNLDARQRAMLQEMGVTVWTRAETTAPRPQPPCRPLRWPCPPPRPPAAPAMAQPPAMPVAQPSPAPAARAPPRPHLRRQPLLQGWAHQAQPCAAPARTTVAAHGGSGTNAARVGRWLAHRDRRHCGRRPSGGDAGKLLDNMLRAMQLHRHPACSWLRWNALHPAPARPKGLRRQPTWPQRWPRW